MANSTTSAYSKTNDLKRIKISLIITTYNWPGALRLSLMSAARQSRIPDEVIVADDGSGNETRELITEMASTFPCPLKHAWQADQGFRAAESRNNALRVCSGDYVILIDGDIVMDSHFVEDHETLAQRGHYVIGSRAKLTPYLTTKLIAAKSLDVKWHSVGVRRRMNAMRLPFLKRFTQSYKNDQPLYGRSCNMAVWLTDLKAVNGFDSALEGYGYEDTDLIARLNNLGCARKFAKLMAVEYHLYHKEKPFAPGNKHIFMQNMKAVACRNGITRRQ